MQGIFLFKEPSEQRQALTRKSDTAALKNLIVHFGSIIIVGWLIVERVYLWPLLLVLQGVLIIFLFTLLHETVHRTAFATRKANDLIALVCGFLVAIPPDWFRYFHFAHHRFTQDPDKDPELITSKPESIWQYIKHLSGIPVWSGQFRTIALNAVGRIEGSYVPAGGYRKLTHESQLFVIVYTALAVASVLLSTIELLYVWVLPVLLGQPFLRIYLLAEHGRCATVANMFANTRTTFTNSLVRLFAWNMPYHTEHHSYPNVPFFRLKELHELMKDHLQETERGYLQFNRKYLSRMW